MQVSLLTWRLNFLEQLYAFLQEFLLIFKYQLFTFYKLIHTIVSSNFF